MTSTIYLLGTQNALKSRKIDCSSCRYSFKLFLVLGFLAVGCLGFFPVFLWVLFIFFFKRVPIFKLGAPTSGSPIETRPGLSSP